MTDRAEPTATPPAVRVTPSLSPTERKALRAAAHHLDPVVMLGEAGLSDAVVAETDRALDAHELIKVRVQGDDRQARAQAMTELCSRLGAAAVQSIGKLLVIYRPRPEPTPTRSTPHQPKKQAGETRSTSRPSVARKPKAKSAQGSRADSNRPSPNRSSTRSGSASTERKGGRSTSVRNEGPAARREGPAARREVPAARREGPAARREGPAARREGPAARREGPAARRAAPAARRPVSAARKRGSHS